jgi:uncharacterized protein (TIGR03083 family)
MGLAYVAMVDHVDALDALVERFVAALRIGSPAQPVPTCPGWSLAELGRHLGGVHRWVIAAIDQVTAPEPGSLAQPPTTDDEVADWVAHGGAALVEVLRRSNPMAATWHPFSAPHVIATWSRRQAHETLVHTVDAEMAALGQYGPIDPWLATDGIAEFFEVIVPRVVHRDRRVTPTGTIVVATTDTGERWRLDADGGVPRVTVPDGPLDPSLPLLAAPATELLLALWGRRSLRADDGGGDPIIAAWLAFGGN